jgi:transcriptional regulator with XRE-family HTH domain
VEARKACGYSLEQMIERLHQLGYKSISRPSLIRLEGGGTRSDKATVNELFAIAAATGGKPLDLITPDADDDPVAIVPGLVFVAPLAREWVRGELVLPMTFGLDLETISDDELRRLIKRELSRGMSPKQRGSYPLDATVDAAVAEIRRYQKEARDGNGD